MRKLVLKKDVKIIKKSFYKKIKSILNENVLFKLILCKSFMLLLTNKNEVEKNVKKFNKEYNNYIKKIELWNKSENKNKNFSDFLNFILNCKKYRKLKVL